LDTPPPIENMKISPEPLAPLSNWRELLQLEPLKGDSQCRKQLVIPLNVWKHHKRTGFSWFTHLFGRASHH